jgi:cytochrome d ubiquinol oxidase subunit II
MDYETLRLVWWALIGILLIGFAVLDGYDLGTAVLLPFLARTDEERRIVLHTVGPVWEGNQVWFIVAGGAIFAAWPMLYAASFSGFYIAMFLVLATLILRPGGFKFRDKVEHMRWRSAWDWALFASGVVPSLVFGVAFGNLFLGVPFGFDSDLRFHSDITLWSLLNPFALLVGLTSLAMIVLHGAAWLNLKTDSTIQARARGVMPVAALAFLLLFALAGLWLLGIDGYAITSAPVHDGASNPLFKSVARVPGGWLSTSAPWAAAGLAIGAAIGAVVVRERPLAAFLCTALVPASTIAAAGLALFPFLLPSSTQPAASLTVWDASSSKLTLAVMLGVVVILLPIIAAYTAFAYRVLRGPVRAQDVRDSKSGY